jgi:hypothetical protein
LVVFAGEGTSKEKRWAVITADGGHVWLGRHTDPDETQIATVTRQLEERGLSAWLAVTEGVYFAPDHDLTVLMVRPLVAGGEWESAKSAFLARRADALKR